MATGKITTDNASRGHSAIAELLVYHLIKRFDKFQSFFTLMVPAV